MARPRKVDPVMAAIQDEDFEEVERPVSRQTPQQVATAARERIQKRIPVSVALSPESLALLDDEVIRLGMPSRSYYIEWLFMRTMSRLPIMYRDLSDYREVAEQNPPPQQLSKQQKSRFKQFLAEMAEEESGDRERSS